MMPKAGFICPHCGKPNWDIAPRAHQIWKFARDHRSGVTSLQIAQRFKISIQGASNTLTQLTRLGFLTKGPAQPHPTGGIFYVFKAKRDNQ